MADWRAVQRGEVEGTVKPTTTASAGPSSTTVARRGARRPPRCPGPPMTSTRSPGAPGGPRPWPSSGRRRRPARRRGPARPRSRSTGGYELLVTNSTRWPAARSRATASAEPGMARWASQTTPSRSQMTVGASGAGTAHGAGCCHAGMAPWAPCPASSPSSVSATTRPGPPGRGRGPSLRRADRGGATALRRPPRPQHRARRRAPRVRRPGRYQEAAAGLAHWRAEGTLVDDPRPSFTLYRMAFTDEAGRRRETVGVIGALEVVADG